MALPHVPWNKRIWILSLWIYLLTDVCKWVDAIRTPEVRRAGAPGSQFVTTNRLAESDGPAPLDYDALLEKINGDFGIRSDVIEAAGQEPEYHGADTLVVPLYIPEGAVPINLARIARSGTPEPDVELVDMKVSPSADSLLIRRIGPVTGRRTSPPRRTSWRPPQRSRPVRLPAIRRSDLAGYRPSPAATTPVVPLLAGFGQRLPAPNHGRLVAVQRLSPHEDVPLSEEDLEDNNKRAKKNELSKDSQFHDFHTTENNASSSSTTSKTPTSTSESTTAGKTRSTVKFPKRLTVPTTTPTTVSTTTTTSTTTTATTTTPAPTTTETTTKSSSTVTPSTTTTDSKPTSPVTVAAPETTTTSTTTAKSDKSTTTTFATLQSKDFSATKIPDALTSGIVWDRRTVLFPKPVESILGISGLDDTEAAISTTTTGTTTTTATTTTSTTTTTETPTTTTRSPAAPLRILPPWLSRTSSSSTTAKSQLIIDEFTQDIKSRTTDSPVRTTTDRLHFTSTEKTTTLSSTSHVPVTTTESPSTTSKRTIIRPVITHVERPTVTERATTEKSTTETTTTLVWAPVNTKRPVIIPQRSSPLKMMLSVDEILREAKISGDTLDVDGTTEITNITLTKSSFVTQPSVHDDRHKITIFEESVSDSDSSNDTTERIENERQWKWPLLRYSQANREDKPIEGVSEPAVKNEDSVLRHSETNMEVVEPTTKFNESDKEGEPPSNLSEFVKEEEEEEEEDPLITEHENKPNVTTPRKIWRRPRPHPENKDHAEREFDHTRPGRRRRPGRPRTSPPPITQLSDFFKIPKETIAFSTTKQDQTTTEKLPKTTIRLATTTLPTPTTTTEKSPEQIVIESLTEIMKDATNNNKSKDKVTNIASNLEALNKQLAERGIHIIHAEVDGVRIKLDNRTLSRHTTPPTPTTFHPPTEFKVTFTPTFSTTTENTSISHVFPMSESNETLLFVNAKTEDELEKDVSTSVRTSFSIHTSKPTDLENETDSENEVQSTTNDSTFTTFKPTEIRKLTTKPIRGESHSPVLSASMLPSSEDVGDDAAMTNNTRGETNPETPIVEETLPPIRTTSPAGDREKEGEESSSASSVAIFASSTVPASVTTRTRSTTVPITTHRPPLRPFLSNSRDRASRPEVITADETTLNSNTSLGEDNTTEPEEQQGTTDVHPTSHHRPTVPKVPEKQSSSEAPVNTGAAKEFSFDTFSYATVQEDTPPTPSNRKSKATLDTATTSSSTTRRPVIEVISITKEIQDAPNAPESVAAAEEVESEDFTETPSSASTTVYAIGVIGIIPAAGLAAFLAKKFLRKTQKALPDSEERAEGFTPVTHHSRKPSQSNTLDVESSSVEAKNPKYTPWEFPRSKLRLVSVLGEGNFGVVWKAEARELCACEGSPGGPTVLVAVKGVKDGAGVKERQDLLKELAIMQHIGQHPNIVTLLGCCTQQEPHYLVMEYVMFGKLLTFLRDHRTRHNYYNFSSDTEALTSRDLTRFACQIATGCDYLQTRGIIHRDLAARNILVDHNKVCKIADFGLARNVKDLGSDIYEQKSRGALPIRWMAPESLYMSIFTHKSDVWSLGILCWEIVTLGSTPYPGMTAREVMRRVREGYRLERPEHCRPEFYHIVTKCWHQDLNKRPTFSELKLEMSKLLDHGHMAYPCIDLENFPEANYFSMHDNDDEKL